MKIRKGGIFKSIDSKDFGLYQKQGWEKVITEPLPKLEEVAPIVEDTKVEPVIEDEPIAEVVDEEPIKEVAQDEPIEEEPIDEMPKPKRNRRK